MGDYFKPWRRKIGVFIWMLACASAVGWIRSEIAIDVVATYAQNITFNLYSTNGTLRLVATGDVSAQQSALIAFGSITNADFLRLYRGHPLIPKILCFPDSNRNALFGSLQILFLSPSFIVDNEIHYWAVTIPLTLLSAWLLLIKPRVVEPKSVTDKPITE